MFVNNLKAYSHSWLRSLVKIVSGVNRVAKSLEKDIRRQMKVRIDERMMNQLPVGRCFVEELASRVREVNNKWARAIH